MSNPVADVVVLAIPERLDPTDSVQRSLLLAELDRMAVHSVWLQFGAHRPKAIEDLRCEWMITRDPADIESFQPGDGCPQCIAGNDRAWDFMLKNPGRWLALGNLVYTPIWEET